MHSECDVVVIGAGIQGAGVAQAAAAAGYHVEILEQTSPAAGTSSRSSKLIHGGLRYLESGQFGLVRKSLQERDVLLDIADEMVTRTPFFVPIYKTSQRRPWQIRAGLMLYAVLGGLRPSNRFRTVPRAEWSTLHPLRTDALHAVFQYWDAQTDDAALTRAVIDSACELGAVLRCPARMQHAALDGDRVHVDYLSENQTHRVTARALVNATGPWANAVLSEVTPEIPRLAVDLVQGTHIVVQHPAATGVFYVEAPQDGRAVFVMPWQGQTLIGTTETLYEGEPSEVRPLPQEVDYLLVVWQHYFPGAGCEVIDQFAGLRVLPRADASMFHRARDTVFYASPSNPRVLTLYGGKLTGYRSTAEDAIRKLAPLLPVRERRADTRRLHLRRRA
jgi:glycerol-3-phosphate dehydrogenase